ncbi:hypothetical protein TRFO_16434 [Tritrichomonas foetus]|uniref:Uncharacterized protein n=1 Tax=Tritrichomonas foetus TaxID=1144522 RepID=A0A1J4KV26_9EUKA|nr:hypothetical protein TRFO_16434 [Tritrichomonas foetus]|eukprot:OHT13357.1 hypothetical protein TRFO_16434 [Tritrichomonas foetus]
MTKYQQNMKYFIDRIYFQFDFKLAYVIRFQIRFNLMEPEEYDFLKLCKQFFRGPNKPTEPLQQFFARLITDNTKLSLTNEVRQYIPKLAQVENGMFINMLTHTVEGITPMHFVPDLQLSPKPPRQKTQKTMPNPRRCKTTRNDLPVSDIKAFMNRSQHFDKPQSKTISKPQTAKTYSNTASLAASTFLRPLPPLKDSETSIIHNLYAKPKSTFYLCKKAQPFDENLKVIPPEYPPHMIGNRYSIMTNRGVVSIEGKNCELTELDQYIKDKNDFYLLERNLFRKRVAYQSFYVWRNRYKVHNFDCKIRKLNGINAIMGPGFRATLDKIRGHFLTVTEDMKVFPTSFDAKIDDAEYSEMIQIAADSMEKITDATSTLADETARKIAEFFNQIQLMKEMMKLNFNELHELDVIPPNLKQYSSDLKYKTPSLHRNQLREEELKTERKVSRSREAYLSTFFKKTRSLYAGLLVIRCREILKEFLTRFDSTVFQEQRATKFLAVFDDNRGLKLSPSRQEFHDWVFKITEEIKAAFLTEPHQLPLDLISELDPNYNCEMEDLYKLLGRFKEIDVIYENVEKAADNAFIFFDKELDDHRQWLLYFSDILKMSRDFNEMRDMDKLKHLVETLVKIRDELHCKPRNIFHKIVHQNESRADFVADMKPAWDAATRMLDREMKDLKVRVLNELNNELFIEIQEKFVHSKEKRKLSRVDVGAFEARCLIYAIMCTSIVHAWPEAMSDCRASFDTVSQMYQQIANTSKYTHADAADSYNENAEKLNVAWVRVQDEEESENDEEEDEYEYVDEEDVND